MNKKGFSLIELLMVMTITVVLIGVSSVGLFNMRRKSDLDKTRDQIVASLGEARSRAINQDEGQSWGVRFTNNSPTSTSYFSIYYSAYSAATEKGKYSLPQNVEFASATVPWGNSLNIDFAELTGKATSTAVPLLLRISPFTSSTITVSSSGIISY